MSRHPVIIILGAMGLAAGLLLALSGCAADAFHHPPTQPVSVIWRTVEPSQVAAACGHPEEPLVDGCYIAPTPGLAGAIGEVITRTPQDGDYSLIGTLAHEMAHANGWRHPAWPGGIE